VTAWRALMRRAERAARAVVATLGAALCLGWVGYYAAVDWAYYRTQGMLGPRGTLRAIDSPTTLLARWCRQRQLSGMLGYADYRLAYPLAFLTGERVRLCPWALRRIPEYAEEAALLDRPWYVALEMGVRGGQPPMADRYSFRRRAELQRGLFRVVIWEPISAVNSTPRSTRPLPRRASSTGDRCRTVPTHPES